MYSLEVDAVIRTVEVAVTTGPVVTAELVTVTADVVVSNTVEAARLEDKVLVAAGNTTVVVTLEVGPDTLFVFVMVIGDPVVVQDAPVTVRVVEAAEPV